MPSLRIMTFNLRRDVEADGPNRWAARRDLVADVVREQAPHLVGTQEGLPNQLADLDERLAGYGRIGCGRDETNEDEACAIYYQKERLLALETGTFWLSDTPEVRASATWGNRHPRIVTWGRFEDLSSGREITIANMHLDHESEEARRRAAALVAQRLPGAILMGDLNAAPGEPTHTFLLGAGWDDGGHREPTFHGFTGSAHVRLDHLLVPRGKHRILAQQVLARARDGVHASDHHPIVVEVAPVE